MIPVRFSTQEINTFNDRILNVLGNQSCCYIFHHYLQKVSPANFNVLKLWVAANDTMEYDEDKFLELIDDVDVFNKNPLLTIAEPECKLGYIKEECCRILESVHSQFMTYLRKHYM